MRLILSTMCFLAGISAAQAAAVDTPPTPAPIAAFDRLTDMLRTAIVKPGCAITDVATSGQAGQRMVTAKIAASGTDAALAFPEQQTPASGWVFSEGQFTSGVPYWRVLATSASLHVRSLEWTVSLPERKSLQLLVGLDDGRQLNCGVSL